MLCLDDSHAAGSCWFSWHIRPRVSSQFQNFTNVESYGSLAGRTLRVAFLPYADEVKSKDPDCCSEGQSCTGCEWEGNVISVYTKIQLWTGFSIEEVVVSNESRIAHPKSVWTACVNDVGRGKVDLCLSTFWILSDRLELTTFAQPFRTDIIALVVPYGENKETTGGGKTQPLLWILEPADGRVWISLLLIWFVTALTLFVTEGGLEKIASQKRRGPRQDVLLSSRELL